MSREQAISKLVDAGAQAWPALKVDRAAFAEHVRSLAADTEGAHAGDLYLAFACMTGDAAAWRQLDEEHLAAIPAAVGRVDRAPAFADEVRQRVAEKLLGPDGKLAGYTGRGPLGGWLRIVALREAQTLVRQRRGVDTTEIADIAGVDNDPELALLKRQSAETFRRAYGDVIAALDDETRTTLRLYFVDGLTYAEIGRVLSVSLASAARRVTAARERLLDGVHEAIRAELGANAPGAETLFALVESQLQLSVMRHFGRTG